MGQVAGQKPGKPFQIMVVPFLESMTNTVLVPWEKLETVHSQSNYIPLVNVVHRQLSHLWSAFTSPRIQSREDLYKTSSRGV